MHLEMHLEAHSFFHMNFGFKVFGNKMYARYCGMTRKLESVNNKAVQLMPNAYW